MPWGKLQHENSMRMETKSSSKVPIPHTFGNMPTTALTDSSSRKKSPPTVSASSNYMTTTRWAIKSPPQTSTATQCTTPTMNSVASSKPSNQKLLTAKATKHNPLSYNPTT